MPMDPTRTAPLRIALVTETFPPEVNGVARTLLMLSQGLTGLGHHLDLIRPGQGEGEEVGDAPWTCLTTGSYPIPFYPGLRLGLPAYWRLKHRWRQTRPNVVHIATEGPLGFSALLAARSSSIPVCTSFHTNFHQYSSFYGYRGLTGPAVAYLRWFHNRADATLVPTEDVQGLLSREGFERLDVLSRGVDTRLFHPRRRSSELRRSWGAGDDDLVAIYVGRIAPEKDPQRAVEAFQGLRDEIPGAVSVVVGDGPARAEMERLDPQTRFCGMRRGEDLAAHYASADMLVFPSQTETFGNVLLEAMASGLPVVGYDYAAGRLLVTEGREGLLAPLGNTDQWLQMTRQLGRLRPAERRAMGVLARQRAEQEGWDHVVERFQSQLQRVADGGDAMGLGKVKPTAPSGLRRASTGC